MRNYENPQKTAENRLPQRAYYIPAGESEYMLLNGEWNFKYFKRDIDAKTEISEWDRIQIPSCWQNLGYENPNYTNINYPYPCDLPYVPDDNPCGVYEREFEIKEKKGKYYFVSEGIASCAYLCINSKYVGFTQGSHLQSEFDITDFVKSGVNTIRIYVLKWCCGSYLEDQDCFRYSGIFRDCYILRRPENHIRDIRVSTNKDTVTVECDKCADIYLYDEKGNILGFEKNTRKAEIFVQNPIFWNAEKPCLYTVGAFRDGEEIKIKTAFRSIEISGKSELLINGKPVKLHGVNHHDTSKFRGWCQTKEELLNDLKAMKKLNINCIRTSHYPPTPEFLNLCDENGFYVVLETDIETHGFVRREANVNYAYDVESGAWPCTMPEWKNEYVNRMQRAALRDINHPCIIMWSTGNESGHGENHKAMIDWLRTLHDGRLVHCEDATRCGLPENADVYSVMYPPYESVEEYARDESKKQPYFMCEYSHAMGNGPGDVYRYNEIINSSPKCIGGCIWEWADHVALDENGVQKYGGDFEGELTYDGNFCCDGMVFADRSFKAGSYEIAAAYQPMSTVLKGDTLEITDRFDFTNLSECEFEYIIECDGKCVSKTGVKLDVKPHETQCIKISLPEGLKAEYGAYLNCNLYQNGVLKACTQHEIKAEKKDIISKTSPAEYTESEYEITFSGEGFEYIFSKHYGTFTSIKTDGFENIIDRPTLTAWRAVTDNDSNMKELWGFYNIWQGENLDRSFSKIYDCEIKDGTITVKGSVAGISHTPFFKYTMEIKVLSDGEIKVSLDGKVKENAVWLPRLGFEFSMPKECGDFNYFAYGPYESYSDMHHASRMGMYESNADSQYVPYVRPQEHGNHYNAKMLQIGGLVFEGEGFEFNVSRYSTAAIHKANHTDELVKSGKTEVRLDYRVSGLGSASCGPAMEMKHKLCEKDIKFDFTVKPKRK